LRRADDARVIGRIAGNGVLIAAGHTTASYEVMMAARAPGSPA
jgi:N-acetylglucosamine-6-phosphate deacetylase